MLTRIDVINYLIQRHAYTTYLEIGCEADLCFNAIVIDHRVGVDPVSGGTIRTTSDKFFEENAETFDIVFVDGLHHAEQVLRDIENSLLRLNNGGTIVVHELNPREEYLQVIPRLQSTWMGDCWKAWVHLRRTRADLRRFVLDIDTGIGVIKLGHQSVVEDDLPLTYENLDSNRIQWLNIIDQTQFKYLVIPTVYAYYEPVLAFPVEIELQLISYWDESWRRRGWNTALLNNEIATQHPSYDKFVVAVRALPTRNKKDYMLQCFVRWLAFLQAGGGMISDYDCINYAYYPPSSVDFSYLTSYSDCIPAYVTAGTAAAELLVQTYIQSGADIEKFRLHSHMYVSGTLELSDMTLLSYYRDRFKYAHIVKNFMWDGWDTAQLVHYHHGSTMRQDRVRTIKAARQLG